MHEGIGGSDESRHQLYAGSRAHLGLATAQEGLLVRKRTSISHRQR